MSLQAGQQQPENGEQSKQPQSDSMNAIATASEVDEATQVPPAPEPQAPQKVTNPIVTSPPPKLDLSSACVLIWVQMYRQLQDTTDQGY